MILHSSSLTLPQVISHNHTPIDAANTIHTAHLPYVKADGIHHCWLDDLLSRENPPRHRNGLGGVTVCGILCALLVHNVVVDPLVARQHLKENSCEIWTGKELQICLRMRKYKVTIYLHTRYRLMVEYCTSHSGS